ncbi:MAG TPA: GNAT family N-acetyltransferase [Caulobacteraceae bacterium]|jgi:predicted GNAT family N-acyltransferase|nr:GNAT family N-acetyltransferase [Caulobacteraceae bacterium]
MTAKINLAEPFQPAALPKAAVSVSVARTLDDLMQAMAIRSVVYMGEQLCPYDEEFDGNDLAGATHLIARIGAQPVGVIRLRWFAEFAKLERLTVMPHCRGGAVPRALLDAAFELAAKKGYRKIMGHTQVRLAPVLMRLGKVKVRPGRAKFKFSDHEYVETIRELTPPADAVTIDSDPLTILRPEGAWDRPGVLDRSAARPATNPHQKQAYASC